MKTLIIPLKKIMLIALLTMIANIAYSQSVQTVYMCLGSTTLNLTPGTTAPVGFKYYYRVTKGGTEVYPLSVTPPAASNFATAGSYTITLSTVADVPNPAVCPPDDAVYTLNILPDLTVSLATPTNNATYCIAAVTKSSSTAITASSVLPAYATDLETEVTYAVTKNGVIVDALTYGTIDATTKDYTLTTAEVGVYNIIATIKYKQKTTNTTSPLLNSSGCPKVSNEQTITVTDKAAKPTITFTAN